MLLKKNPNVIDQIITYDKSPLIELTPENWQVAAGVADSFGQGYYDPTIFKIQFVQVKIEFNSTTNSKYISKLEYKSTHLCNTSDFSDNSTFNNYGLNNFFCPTNGTFLLEGGFDEKEVKAIVVLISYCNNKTDGVICKTQDQINKFLNGKGLWFYYQDDIYDLSNYENPLKKNFKLQAIQVAAVPRIIDIYMKKLKFINDDDFFFEHYEQSIGFMKDRIEGLSHYLMVDSPLISFNFFSSKAVQSAKRQYQKFGDLLANIGGIINILMILGFMLTNMKNKIIMQNHIMNNLYNFNLEKKLKQNELKDNFKGKKENYDWESNIEEFEKNYSKEKIPIEIERKKTRIKQTELNIIDFKSPTEKELFEIKNRNYLSNISSKDDININNNNIRYGQSKFFSRLNEDSQIKNLESGNEIKESHIERIDKLKKMVNLDLSNQIREIKLNNLNLDIPSIRIRSGGLATFGNITEKPHKLDLSPELQPKLNNFNEKKNNKINFHLFHDEKSAIDMSLMSYFKMQLKLLLKFELSDKEKLFRISEKRFCNETDIVYILQKIQEFEKLKVVLLSKEQLELFNLLSKPLIYLEEKEKKDYRRFSASYKLAKSMRSETNVSAKINEGNLINLENYYQKLVNQSKLSFIDKNILKLLREEDT